jgi:3-dehydroquinate dehydratase-2
MKQMLLTLALLAVTWPVRGDASSASITSISSQEAGDTAPTATLVRAATATADQTPSARRLKILLLQGANLSYLGRREPELYGATSAAELDAILRAHARAHGYDLEIFYTHVEGEAIGRLYKAVDEGFDGVVMNPGGFTYNGYALRDCLRALPIPYIEVHITNIDKRAIHSVIAEVAVGVISGFGTESYIMGLDAMLKRLTEKDKPRR